MKLDDFIQQPGMNERALIDQVMQRVHVALPGTVLSYNSANHTAVIQPSIRRPNSSETPPILKDVPVFFPGYMMFDVSEGDECLVVFADQCIDAWFNHGGVSTPILSRMHDLSDGFALVGFFNSSSYRTGVDIVAKLNELEGRIEALEEGDEDQ